MVSSTYRFALEFVVASVQRRVDRLERLKVDVQLLRLVLRGDDSAAEQNQSVRRQLRVKLQALLDTLKQLTRIFRIGSQRNRVIVSVRAKTICAFANVAQTARTHFTHLVIALSTDSRLTRDLMFEAVPASSASILFTREICARVRERTPTV